MKDKENQGRRVKQTEKTVYTISSHLIFLLVPKNYYFFYPILIKAALNKGTNTPIKSTNLLK